MKEDIEIEYEVIQIQDTYKETLENKKFIVSEKVIEINIPPEPKNDA